MTDVLICLIGGGLCVGVSLFRPRTVYFAPGD